MKIREIKHFDYEEKIAIVKEVKKVGNRLQVAHKYDIGENVIRAWEKDLQAGRLEKKRKLFFQTYLIVKCKQI